MFRRLKILKASAILFAGVISFAASSVGLFDRFIDGRIPPETAPQDLPVQFSGADDKHEVGFKAHLLGSLTERLKSRNCDFERIDILGFDEQRTPASETTSGLDGHYIAATLHIVRNDHETPVNFRAESNGKGPIAESQAYDGLHEKIENRLNELIVCED